LSDATRRIYDSGGSGSALGDAERTPPLGSLAYRLLATLTDVEAAVQAAYIQWYRLTAEERDVIEDPSCTMTSP